MTVAANAGLVSALRGLVAEEGRVSTSASVLHSHGEDVSYHPRTLPDVVVFPVSTAEVSAVLRFANERRIPVVPFGAGSSVEGHVLPVRGGISLDLMRMDRITAVYPEDFTAVVQPGVLRSALNGRVNGEGLFFSVDPGADASLGGMAATNASGTTAIRYGVMRDQILGLEVVLAGGDVVRTGGRAFKTSAGYGLTHLFAGSEGTLGVITELTVRLHGIPECTVAARAAFPSVEAACRTAATLVGAGIPVSRVELLDAPTMRAVNRYEEASYPEAPTLFLEFAGTETSVAGELAFAREAAAAEGCPALEQEIEVEARNRLWRARHNLGFAVMATAPGKRLMTTDVCVPISQMPEAVHRIRVVLDEQGLASSINGHVGDGNYHVAFMIDPDAPEEVAAAVRLNELIVEDALARGGTCTGEHGIGLGKIGYLEREHGDALPLMRAVKSVLDPNGILNPGKVLAG
jgi:D-lactate dehydrogenase (cytochrome)